MSGGVKKRDSRMVGYMKYPAKILLLAAVYVAASKLGFTMAFEAEQVTAVWPPTGIALTAILLWGYRLWPGVALGAFIANVTTHEPILTATAICIGNTLEALCGAWMLNRFVRFSTSFNHLRDVLGLVLFAAIGSTMIAATVGVASLCISQLQPWDAYSSLWILWWLGDMTGALIVAPLLLVWSKWPREFWRSHSKVEALCLFIALGVICLGTFTGMPAGRMVSEGLIYLSFPMVIWAALRFDQYGVTLVTTVASVLTILATLWGYGPFATGAIDQQLTLLQIFTAVVSATGLLLSASISERRQADEARERLAAIVESSDDAVIGKTLDEIINFWNAGAERLFGYTAEEAIGQSVQLIMPDMEEERQITQRLLRGERIEHYETVRKAKDGRLIYISLTISPIRNARGEIIGASKIARDIGARKQMEDTLRENDRRKDEFLATLAHELRNPLAPLSNSLHIMEQSNADKLHHDEAMTIAKRQVKHMERLVNDLLDVSRISHGKIELQKENITLVQVMHYAMETMQPVLESRRHDIVINTPQDHIWLNADLVRLAQVFANLLSNAAKYTPEGGHITLTASADQNTVEVRVRDSGIGIPAEMLPKIFDVFMQVDNSIERTHEGLGIGLNLVKNLVEMHGGTVSVHSDGEGKGSEFIVRLPRVLASNIEIKPKKPEAAKEVKKTMSENIPQQKLRILVTDDSVMSAKTLGYLLEVLGHEVQLTYDGASALTAASSFHPDVIFLDIGLPGMNGYDVCRQIRLDPALKNSVLVAQTGWSQQEHRQRSKEAGFDFHLVKPVDLDVVQKLLASLGPRLGDGAAAH